MRKEVFHLVGLCTLPVVAGFTLMVFVLIGLNGRVGFNEPNLWVLGCEVGLFGFTFAYSLYSLKVGMSRLINKVVWVWERDNFYEKT